MTEDGENKGTVERIIDRIAEGGLPEMIAGPAGKAFSRLIGGAADIPAAKLEQWAQAIRNRTASDKLISDSVASSAAQIAASDADYTRAAVERALGKAVRSQDNATNVALIAADYLREDPGSTQTSPSDDWLNFFESVAERASSESLRDILARVLAGEIRNSGSFSLRTISFFSTLTKKEAEIIQQSASFILGQHAIRGDIVDGHPHFDKFLALEEMSLISLNRNTSYDFKIGHDINWKVDKHTIIQAKNVQVSEITIGTHVLTTMGKEVFKIVDADIDAEYIEEVRIKLSEACSTEFTIIRS